MWLLLLTCVSTVGGLPINQSQDVITLTPGNVTVTPGPDGPQPVSIQSAEEIPHNVTSPEPGVTFYFRPPQTTSAETLEELKGDFLVQEGDILMPEDRNAVETLWPDAVVPYVIRSEVAHREWEIDTAFEMISAFTCIRFRRHAAELSYLEIKDGRGCASFVGCRGGAQSLYFAQSCSVGNLCHELVHALGLHHEHTRKDRDQHIAVQWQSIVPDRKNNFKVVPGDTLNLPYDLNSIMHYGQFFFSADGSATMLSKESGGQMGQRKHLSQLDIQKLNTLYHCAERMRSQ